MRAQIRVGTSSWAEKTLIDSGRFYPADVLSAGDRIRYFAQHFSLAEVDSSYYALPSARNSREWLERTPDGFRFIVKAFALFTAHPAQVSSIPKNLRDALPDEVRAKARIYAKDVPEDIYAELWEMFRRAIWRLNEAARLAAVLLDFPPWFHPNDANRAFIADARERLPEYPIVVEFRSPGWVKAGDIDRTMSVLRDNRLGFACIDEPAVEGAFPPVVESTADVAAIRFRGRNAETWAKKGATMIERLNHNYTDDELREWLPRIEQLGDACDDLYIVFNTKFEDQGILNARRMMRLLREELGVEVNVP